MRNAEGLCDHPRWNSYLSSKDLTQSRRDLFAIDLFPVDDYRARLDFPEILQHVADYVKPERDQNNEPWRKKHWYWYGRTNENLRAAVVSLDRVIVTSRTAKHGIFQFEVAQAVTESEVVTIALNDAFILAVLSTKLHRVWALASGGTLEDRPRYTHSRTFDPFPFPDPNEAQKARLRSLGEQLDAHRKAQAAAHPKLTLTAMYNVLEKLRAGERIEGKDREIYDQGLIGILRDLHDQIDTAVAQAYGWPATLTDDEILHRLVDLNRERAAEEARGLIRWLRPDYQNPAGHAAEKGEQITFDVGQAAATAKAPWPKTLPEQFAAVRAALAELGTATPEQVARHFARTRATTVEPLLAVLAGNGLAHQTEDGRFAM
jgi:hypothetical protein